MARFGVLMLNHGKWGADQVVSSDWVAEATGKSSTQLNAAYGYLWWLNRSGNIGNPLVATSPDANGGGGTRQGQLVPGAPADMYWAIGLGNQIVQVDPGRARSSSAWGPRRPGRNRRRSAPRGERGRHRRPHRAVKSGMFADYRRKRALRRDGFPDEWRVIIESNVVHWRVLGADDRELLEDYVVRLVTEKRWEAAHGFALTDEIQVTIAAQAALLVLGLGYEAYEVSARSSCTRRRCMLTGERGGPIAAPCTTAAPRARRGPLRGAGDHRVGLGASRARHPERGHNVVYHEFAHKIDMLDGLVDGTPPLERDEERDAVDRGVHRGVPGLAERHRRRVLDGYAAVNPGEFFAVVTEAFFDLPARWKHAKPELYGVLRDFYRQDPARVARERA